MPTPKIFDFDENQLSIFEPDDMDRALAEHPAIYVNHLQIAKHLDAWAARVRQTYIPDVEGEASGDGFAQALDDVAALLRQAAYVPGGPFLKAE